MADKDLKSATPDTSLPTDGFLFGADSQSATDPSVYTVASVKQAMIGAGSVSIASGKTFTASNTLTLAGTDSTTMTFPSTSATIARTDAGNTFTGAQTFSVGTVNGTGLDISQTWTGTGTYTGLKYNVGTDSGPSNAASRLLDLQVGGTPAFYISKNTDIVIGTLSNKANFNGRIYPGTDGEGSLGASFSRWGDVWVFKTINIQGSSGAFTFSATDGSGALTLTRAAAATLQLGAADTTGTTAPTAQFLRVQSWSSSTTNNQTGADFTIQGSRGTGTGAGGSIIFQVAPAGGSSNGVQNAYASLLSLGVSGSPSGGDRSIGFRGSSAVLWFTNNIFGSSAASQWTISHGGTGLGYFESTGLTLTTPLSFATGVNNSPDTYLYRDGQPNTLALRNGGTSSSPVPQRFNIYNYWASASDYERLSLFFNSNNATIFVDKAGSGSYRDLVLQGYGNIRFLPGNLAFLDLSPTTMSFADAINIAFDTTTGTKIGTATSQKIGFWNATPAVQPTAVADATNATDVITQLNALLSRMRTIGIIAT